jgi:3-oxoacid CoA-transferase subunit B
MERVVKGGSFKLVNDCWLPYIDRGAVQRIITDICGVDVLPPSQGVGLRFVEFSPGVGNDAVGSNTERRLEAK